MAKVITTITIDEKLKELAKLQGINISQEVSKVIQEKVMGAGETNKEKAEQLIKELKEKLINEFLKIPPITIQGKKNWIIENKDKLYYWVERLQIPEKELKEMWLKHWNLKEVKQDKPPENMNLEQYKKLKAQQESNKLLDNKEQAEGKPINRTLDYLNKEQ